MKEKHEHEFKLAEKKVQLHKGKDKDSTGRKDRYSGMVGYDILKVWSCACGAEKAFDIKERVVV